jgi:hypothetical protein
MVGKRDHWVVPGILGYFRLRRMAMADRIRPASEKVAGSGTVVAAPLAKVTSSMKVAVLPAGKPIETGEISVSVDVIGSDHWVVPGILPGRIR